VKPSRLTRALYEEDMNHNRALTLLFATFIAFTSIPVREIAAADTQIDPKSILQEVKLKGARAVVSELYGTPKTWHATLERIASGDQSWLDVAVALHPGSDAGSSEMLNLAVGAALENNPAKVFQTTLKTFQLKSICSAPDVDDPKYDSYELSMKAINQRISKVSSITGETITDINKACIQYLEESKKGIAQFYQVKSK
jgi:hypothetical protein